MNSAESEHPTLVLCDWAEVINGKLYMMGAGWSRLMADTPAIMAIALLWQIPWKEANRPQAVEITLVTEDGQPFLDSEGNPLSISGDIEVGRPPGMKPGSSLDAPMAFKLPGIAFPAGGYRFEFRVNGSLEAKSSFEAIGGRP